MEIHQCRLNPPRRIPPTSLIPSRFYPHHALSLVLCISHHLHCYLHLPGHSLGHVLWKTKEYLFWHQYPHYPHHYHKQVRQIPSWVPNNVLIEDYKRKNMIILKCNNNNKKKKRELTGRGELVGTFAAGGTLGGGLFGGGFALGALLPPTFTFLSASWVTSAVYFLIPCCSTLWTFTFSPLFLLLMLFIVLKRKLVRYLNKIRILNINYKIIIPLR